MSTDSGGFFVKVQLVVYASVRDQRVSARVVSFPVSPIDTSATMVSVKTTIRTGSTGSLVLYAHPAITRQPVHLGAFLRSEAVNLSTDSVSNREAKGLVWKAEWSAPLSANLLASARVGQFVVRREDLPRGSRLVSRTRDTGCRWRQSDVARRSPAHTVSGSLGYLHEGLGGRHQLTAGGESLHAVAAETWY